MVRMFPRIFSTDERCSLYSGDFKKRSVANGPSDFIYHLRSDLLPPTLLSRGRQAAPDKTVCLLSAVCLSFQRATWRFFAPFHFITTGESVSEGVREGGRGGEEEEVITSVAAVMNRVDMS